MKENNSKTDIKTKENKKPDIKIFVSHRIDLDAETIDNPLYVNVRCGAVFDKRENIDMLGDDTGDNISKKRGNFCELTVQYWAWKNVDADYYGLCHYRRYLSFADKFQDTNDNAKSGVSVNSIVCDYINDIMKKKYNLNKEYMSKEISKYDIIKMDVIDLSKYSFKNNKEQVVYSKEWHRWEDFETVRKIIKEKFSQYLPYYDKYMNCKYGYFYMLYIMNKKYFNMYCEFIFGILFELEKRIDKTYLSVQQNRLFGTVGERLYGVFMMYVQDNFKAKIGEKQVIFVDYPAKKQELFPFSNQNNIPIVVRISDYYAPYFGVLLQSIIDNADSNNNYDVIVLEHTVTKENKEIIANMLVGKDNISVRYFDPEYLLYDISFYIPLAIYSKETYYTILTPWLLPNYDKLLILDCDLILTGDVVEEIYNQDISNYFAAACKDILFGGMLNVNDNGYVDYAAKTLKLKNPYNYVNAGVILLNTAKIRKELKLNFILKKLKKSKYRICEQDLINVVFDERIKFIDNKYNFFVEVNESISNMIKNSPKYIYDMYTRNKSNPLILHYAGKPKPWDSPQIPLGYRWWEIARKTPFYEIVFIRFTHGQSGHISFATTDHFNRIMFPFKWLKKVHKIGYIRQIADKLLPHGSKRRKIIKKLLFG